MAILGAREFEKSLPGALASKRIIILFGDNVQVRNDLFRLVRKALSIQNDDPFRLVQLDSDMIESDPARLGDELGAISMFGGSRLIRVSTAVRQAEHVVELALNAPAGEWLLVVDVDAFNASEGASRLASDALLVSCSPESAGDFHAFVRGEFERLDVKAEEGVIDFLIPLLGEDRAAARGEVEKLALLAEGSKTVSVGDLKNIVADGSTLVAEEIAAAALSGDQAALSVALDRLGTTGADATAALGAASRLVLNILRGRASQWKGRADQVLQDLPTPQVRAIALSLQSAVLQTRSDGPNAALFAERALVSLGNAVRARRR
ncbi:MAG: hypothetical protein QM651_00045 [Rhodoblastus sp.]